MAFVRTARYLGDPVTTLASILQGEAGGQGPMGMQAVWNVISNRAAIDFQGRGGDWISQATSRLQFQGQATPGPAAMQVAREALAGNLEDITGGALYYANPGASSAAWARNLNSSNSLRIGDHYFTDNATGRPFYPGVEMTGRGDLISNGGDLGTGTAAPVSDNSGVQPLFTEPSRLYAMPGGNPSMAPGSPSFRMPASDTTPGEGFDNVPGETGGNPYGGLSSVGGPTFTPGAGYQMPAGTNGDTPARLPTSYSMPGGTDGGITAQEWSNPETPVQQATPDQANPSSNISTSVLSGMWEQLGVTATTQAGKMEAEATQAAAQTQSQAIKAAVTNAMQTIQQVSQLAAKTETANAQQAEKAATGWVDSVLNTSKDLFQRGIVGLLGLVFVFGAMWYLASHSALAAPATARA